MFPMVEDQSWQPIRNDVSLRRGLVRRNSWPYSPDDLTLSMENIIGKRETKEELPKLKEMVTSAQGDHKTMQQQAAAIVRDMKNALQLMNAQQNLLSTTITQEASRVSQMTKDQQDLKSIVEDHLSHQGASIERVESQQQVLVQGVEHIDSQRRLLEQEVVDSTIQHNVMTEQLKNQMEADYHAFTSLQSEYAKAQQMKTEERNHVPMDQYSSMNGIPSSTGRRLSADNAPLKTDSFIAPELRASPFSPDTRQQATTISLYSPIRKPPKFDVDRFSSYKEELDSWKDSHPHVSESTLIAEIALQSEIPLRTIMLQFMRETKTNKEGRCFSKLIEVLNVEFQRDSHERALLKMQKSSNSSGIQAKIYICSGLDSTRSYQKCMLVNWI